MSKQSLLDEIKALTKALEAGGYGAAPTSSVPLVTSSLVVKDLMPKYKKFFNANYFNAEKTYGNRKTIHFTYNKEIPNKPSKESQLIQFERKEGAHVYLSKNCTRITKDAACHAIIDEINWLADEGILLGSLATLSEVKIINGGISVFFFPGVPLELAPWLAERYYKKGLGGMEGTIGA